MYCCSQRGQLLSPSQEIPIHVEGAIGTCPKVNPCAILPINQQGVSFSRPRLPCQDQSLHSHHTSTQRGGGGLRSFHLRILIVRGVLSHGPKYFYSKPICSSRAAVGVFRCGTHPLSCQPHRLRCKMSAHMGHSKFA